MSDASELANRLPTDEEIASAAAASSVIARAQQEPGSLKFSSRNGEHDEFRLAPAIADQIIELLGHIAQGKTVKLLPTGSMLTTQQAADILNVSRPFLSKLLKENKIPHVPIGSHRRVMFDDLIAYKKKRDSVRKAALDELARLGQEFDTE